jgi:DNA segregation ATPase FtsK/SpoIIIE, S-DNA-T family
LREALEGELTRRQRELADVGAASVREHPMSRLLIVVDEFSELVAAEPQIAELFTRLARLGRSLGIHLLLSTQRLEEGRLQGLEAHLSYRIAMRTFTATESRIAIGSSLAAELPRRPGTGLLAAHGTTQRFNAPDPGERVGTEDRIELVCLRTQSEAGPTVLEDRLARATGPVAPALWLPPLDAAPRLADLPTAPHLQATIGWVDRPRDQHIDPLTLDLTGAGGHVAIVGGPRSGKSTALRTLASALRSSTPGVRLLGLDLTGGLTGVLPPARIATARTPERVTRLIRHVTRLTQEGASPPVVVLIDGWGAMRDNYAWVDGWHQVAERGLAADVHVVVATHRWSDLRPAVRDLFGTRLELTLGDPLESEIDRKLAAALPRKPGRGLVAPGFVFQLGIDSPS